MNKMNMNHLKEMAAQHNLSDLCIVKPKIA